MDLKRKGWLRRYLSTRCISEKLTTNTNTQKGNDFQELFYSLMQPTGLIYGYPLSLPDLDQNSKINAITNINERDRLKIVLTESLLQCGSMYYNDQDHRDIAVQTEYVIEKIGEFYAYLLGKKTSIASLIGKKNNEVDSTEQYIEQHIKIKKGLKSFWVSFFSNSLIFLDVLFFYSWLDAKERDSDAIKNQRERIFILILQIIAAAAGADGVIDEEESAIFDYYKFSAQLHGEQKKEVASLLLDGISLDQIDFTILTSWLLKKYLLDIAVLTVWVNQVVDKKERLFLEQLIKRLDLSKKDLKNSMLAIESFVVNNWDNVHYLQKNKEYSFVADRLKNRVQEILADNKDKLLIEVTESKELLFLLKESRKRQLNDEEKAKVKNQLLDILKTIPSLAFFLMPMGSILLPIALKILPQQILIPSAFQNKDT